MCACSEVSQKTEKSSIPMPARSADAAITGQGTSIASNTSGGNRSVIAKRRRKFRCRSGAKAPRGLASRFTPLAPVPLQPEVALGVRRSLVVVLDLVGVGGETVGPGGRDESLLVHPVGDAVGPTLQRGA